jgi:hypothetical protein
MRSSVTNTTTQQLNLRYSAEARARAEASYKLLFLSHDSEDFQTGRFDDILLFSATLAVCKHTLSLCR